MRRDDVKRRHAGTEIGDGVNTSIIECPRAIGSRKGLLYARNLQAVSSTANVWQGRGSAGQEPNKRTSNQVGSLPLTKRQQARQTRLTWKPRRTIKLAAQGSTDLNMTDRCISKPLFALPLDADYKHTVIVLGSR